MLRNVLFEDFPLVLRNIHIVVLVPQGPLIKPVGNLCIRYALSLF